MREVSLYSNRLNVVDKNRSEVHLTITINGTHQKDPRAAHVTFSYKSQDHLSRETRITCHGYIKDLQTLEFREATRADENPDSTRKQSGKAVWPEASQLRKLDTGTCLRSEDLSIVSQALTHRAS